MTGIHVKNHSDGTLAGVTQDHQIKTRTESHELQHHVSWHDGDAYQVMYNDTGINDTGGGDSSLLHLTNLSATKNAVVSFIRLSAVTTGDTGGNAGDTGHYFELGFGSTITAGDSGSAANAPVFVNMNRTSGKAAAMRAVGDGDMGGTFDRFDRVPAKFDGTQTVYNKHGSLILGQNDTMDIRFTSEGVGTATARVTVMMLNKERG